MNKQEYLVRVIQSHRVWYKRWIISAFAITNESPEDARKAPYPYPIVRSNTMIGTWVDDHLEVIEDADPALPLFTWDDVVVVGPELCVNVKEPKETHLGNVIFNQACVVTAFGNKVPFQFGKVSIENIESFLEGTIESVPKEGTPRKEGVVYIDEYRKFVKTLPLLSGISTLAVWSATLKTMTPPPGLAEFKQALFKKYEGKLTDSVAWAALEKELQDFDDKYLPDDPANRGFLKGKVKDIARKKLYLTVGVDATFNQGIDVTPITNSLEEGWPKDSKQFTTIMNVLRAGSYARGTETVKGGVAAKLIIRACQNLAILPNDCGTTLGLKRYIPSYLSYSLVGREVREDNQWVLVSSDEEAKKYVGKEVVVRSPGYCFSEGNTFCSHCVGRFIAENPQGLIIAGTEISAIILAASMAAMHSKKLAVTRMDYKTVLC